MTAPTSSSELERLAEHVVDPRAQRRPDLARAREQHDPDRQLERLELVDQVEPVVEPDVQIEQDDVRQLLLDLLRGPRRASLPPETR